MPEEQPNDQRALVLIDNGYLGAILRDEFSEQRINYQKLSDGVCHGYERLRTYVYDCPPYQSNPSTFAERQMLASKQAFFESLNRLPATEVRQGKLRPRGNGVFVQKGVDILLAIDLVLLAAKRRINRAFLFAGDADFVPAVKVAKSEGVSVTLYHSSGLQQSPDGRYHKKYSDELWLACDHRIPITSGLISAWKFEPRSTSERRF